MPNPTFLVASTVGRKLSQAAWQGQDRCRTEEKRELICKKRWKMWKVVRVTCCILRFFQALEPKQVALNAAKAWRNSRPTTSSRSHCLQMGQWQVVHEKLRTNWSSHRHDLNLCIPACGLMSTGQSFATIGFSNFLPKSTLCPWWRLIQGTRSWIQTKAPVSWSVMIPSGSSARQSCKTEHHVCQCIVTVSSMYSMDGCAVFTNTCASYYLLVGASIRIASASQASKNSENN